MKKFNRFNVLTAAFFCFIITASGLYAKEFGFITNDPRFPGTENINGKLTGFFFYNNYNDARTAMNQHGDVLDCEPGACPQSPSTQGFKNFWWQVSYIPLPHPDTIKAHQNTYPATDAELTEVLNFVNMVGYNNGAGGFSMIIQMEGGPTFAAADNDLFKRLGLPGAHQTDDSSDAVVSFPHPTSPFVTAVTGDPTEPLWAPLKSFTWKGVGRFDKLDSKMECMAADQNGKCIMACVEKGVLGGNIHAGGIFFLMDNEILTDWKTNDVNEQNLWGNLADYGISDQFRHYVYTVGTDSVQFSDNGTSQVVNQALQPAGMNNVSIVNNTVLLDKMGAGEKSISIIALSGKRLFCVKEAGATFTMPKIKYQGMVLVTVESHDKKAVIPYLLQ